MKSSNNWMKSGLVLAIGAVCIAFALSAGAQVQTTTITTAGLSSQVVKVERGEVLARKGANRDLELTISAICMLYRTHPSSQVFGPRSILRYVPLLEATALSDQNVRAQP